jgi:DNA recombination protein RmuC
MITALLVLLSAALAAGIAWMLCKARLSADYMQQHSESLTTIATLKAQLQTSKDREQTLLSDRAELGETLKKEFSLMAGQLLDAKAQQFNQQQETKLTDLLTPFRRQIEDFGKQVGEKFINEGKEKSALQREIELLAKASGLLSKQATDLTAALRGSTKTQGDWGEGILEQILEFCGLKEGVHYTTQSFTRTDEGTGIKPDVIVHLPGGRKLVIDSKVSLIHYWDLCAEEAPEARAEHLPRITGSLKQHIDGLHRKPYNEVSGTPDYLVMFVPVEAAYITALQYDHTLWQYAYSRGVVLISPTNLIPFIRVVQNLWDRDDKYRNAEAIAEKAGKLYDKLVTFVTSYQKVGSELEAAQKAYNEGMGQLASGRDNLISQAEKMKALNISNKKSLPLSMSESAMLNDGIQLPAAPKLVDPAVPSVD